MPDVLAAVDLGSNSFHMVVARYSHGQLLIVDRLRESVRLAAGLDEQGRLGREAVARALQCLERFGQRQRSQSWNRFRRRAGGLPIPLDHGREVPVFLLVAADDKIHAAERSPQWSRPGKIEHDPLRLLPGRRRQLDRHALGGPRDGQVDLAEVRRGTADLDRLALGQPPVGHGRQQVQFVAPLVDQHVPQQQGIV